MWTEESPKIITFKRVQYSWNKEKEEWNKRKSGERRKEKKKKEMEEKKREGMIENGEERQKNENGWKFEIYI